VSGKYKFVWLMSAPTSGFLQFALLYTSGAGK
jgi:hypothetical protein